MSFNIHCVAGGPGTRHYVYERQNVPEGDEWEFNFVEKQILKRLVGASVPTSITGSATRTALRVMSALYQVHFFQNAIGMMAIEGGDGVLNIYVRHDHLFWPTTGENGQFEIGRRVSPNETATDVLRFLGRNGMNKWGPVIEILHAIENFCSQYSGRSGYIISITLRD